MKCELFNFDTSKLTLTPELQEFIICKTQPSHDMVRSYIQSLWNLYEPYAENNFPQKFATPYIIPALFPIKTEPYAIFNLNTSKFTKVGTYKLSPNISRHNAKSNTKAPSVNKAPCFLQPYPHISGIIYSTVNYRTVGDQSLRFPISIIVYVHNPYAINPLPQKFFPWDQEYVATELEYEWYLRDILDTRIPHDDHIVTCY